MRLKLAMERRASSMLNWRDGGTGIIFQTSDVNHFYIPIYEADSRDTNVEAIYVYRTRQDKLYKNNNPQTFFFFTE